MSFADFIIAAEKGAASVYHQVLATGASVLSWGSNPLVAPLVQVGVASANAMLERAGVPSGVATVVESDIHAALSQMAAADPTVPSGNGISALAGLAGGVATALIPGAAPVVAVAEGVLGAAEQLAVKTTTETTVSSTPAA